jgi:hypothetical protein
MAKVRVGGGSSASRAGTFNPASGLPTAGTGKNGAIVKGDWWLASGSGTIASLSPFTVFAAGDTITALVNNADAVGEFVGNTGYSSSDSNKQDLIITETILTDGASIALVQQNNVLATSRSTITFTISNTSTFIYLTITLTGTNLVLTFPANSLCVGSSGTASGDNTCTLSGTSGDVYEIAIKKRVSTYSVVAKNFGQ